jgi:hypothetical protein
MDYISCWIVIRSNDSFKKTMTRRNNRKPGKRQRWRNSSISLITNNANEKLVCPRFNFSSLNDVSTEWKPPEYPGLVRRVLPPWWLLSVVLRFFNEFQLVLRNKRFLFIFMVEPCILRLIDCLLPTNALDVHFI